MKAYNEIKKELEARKDRSAWDKGVTKYALELLEEYRERAEYEGREAADRAEFKTWLRIIVMRTPGSPTATAVHPSFITGTLQNGSVARLSISAPVRVSADLTAAKNG